jgi:hypothetical protein
LLLGRRSRRLLLLHWRKRLVEILGRRTAVLRAAGTEIKLRRSKVGPSLETILGPARPKVRPASKPKLGAAWAIAGQRWAILGRRPIRVRPIQHGRVVKVVGSRVKLVRWGWRRPPICPEVGRAQLVEVVGVGPGHFEPALEAVVPHVVVLI